MCVERERERERERGESQKERKICVKPLDRYNCAFFLHVSVFLFRYNIQISGAAFLG